MGLLLNSVRWESVFVRFPGPKRHLHVLRPEKNRQFADGRGFNSRHLHHVKSRDIVHSMSRDFLCFGALMFRVIVPVLWVGVQPSYPPRVSSLECSPLVLFPTRPPGF